MGGQMREDKTASAQFLAKSDTSNVGSDVDWIKTLPRAPLPGVAEQHSAGLQRYDLLFQFAGQ